MNQPLHIFFLIYSDVSNDISNEDLEDGEIEDDEDEAQAPPEADPAPDQLVFETAPPPFPDPVQQPPNTDIPPPRLSGSPGEKLPGERFLIDGPPPCPPSNQEKFRGGRGRGGRFDRRDDRRGRRGGGGAGAGGGIGGDPEGGGGSNKRHLTEAEKSVMYLHKIERQEREKRERFKREQGKRK